VLDVAGVHQVLSLEAGTLAFTLCQVPIVYRRAAAPAVAVAEGDGVVRRWAGDELPPAIAAEVFGRTGRIHRVEVDVVGLYEA
jgi:hypothetical protein